MAHNSTLAEHTKIKLGTHHSKQQINHRVTNLYIPLRLACVLLLVSLTVHGQRKNQPFKMRVAAVSGPGVESCGDACKAGGAVVEKPRTWSGAGHPGAWVVVADRHGGKVYVTTVTTERKSKPPQIGLIVGVALRGHPSLRIT